MKKHQHHLVVPRHRRSTLGRRAFSVAGPMAWRPPRPVAQCRQFQEEAKDASVSECTSGPCSNNDYLGHSKNHDWLIDWTLSALEALCNAQHKFKTYLLLYNTACGSQSYTTAAATARWTAVTPLHNYCCCCWWWCLHQGCHKVRLASAATDLAGNAVRVDSGSWETWHLNLNTGLLLLAGRPQPINSAAAATATSTATAISTNNTSGFCLTSLVFCWLLPPPLPLPTTTTSTTTTTNITTTTTASSHC